VKQLLYYECGFFCLKLEAFGKMLYVNYKVHSIVFVFPNRLPEKLDERRSNVDSRRRR